MVSSKSLVLLAIAAMLVGVLLAGCGGGGSDSTPVDTTGAVSGHIVDFTSMLALGGVTVSAGGQTVQSDANGNFVLDGLQPGSYKLAFTPDPATGLVLPPGSSEPTVTVYAGQTTQFPTTVYLFDQADVPPTWPTG
jgi:hypothetical protein